MAIYSIGSYTLGNFLYSLFEEASSAPSSQAIRVLDHFQRKGTPNFTYNQTLLPHDVRVDFLDRDGSLFNRVSTATAGQFLIIIYRSGSEIFRGWYVPEVDEESLSVRDVRLKLRFADGLELLKQHSWPGGANTFADLFRELFDKIGYQLPIAVNVDLEADGTTSSPVFVNHHRTDLFGLLNRKPEATYYDVLVEILTLLKAWCWQENGEWYIYQYSNRHNTAVEWIDVDDIVQPKTRLVEKTVSRFLAPIRRKRLKGIKRINRTVQAISKEAEVTNTDFEQWNENDSEAIGWEVESGSIAKVDSLTDDGALLRFNNSSMAVIQPIYRMIGGRGDFNVSVKVEFESVNGSGVQAVPVAEIILHNNNPVGPGSWEKRWLHSGGLSATQTYLRAEYEIPSGITEDPTTVSATASASTIIPNAAVIWAEIKLVSTNDPDVDDSAGWYMKYVEVTAGGDIKFGGPVPDQYLETAQVSGNSDADVITDIVSLGDDVLVKHKSDFEHYTGSAWEQSTGWKTSNHSSAESINQVCIDNWLRKLGKRLNVIKLNVKHSEDVDLIDLYTMDHFGSDEEFIPFYIEATASTRKKKLYVVEYPSDQALS